MAESLSNSSDKADPPGTGSEKSQFLDVTGKPIQPYPEGRVIRREIVKSGFALDRVAYAPETIQTMVEDTRRLMVEDGYEVPFRPDHPQGRAGADPAPLPAFGRMVNVEIEGEGDDTTVYGTISLNRLGNQMVTEGLFPGVSIGLQPLPSMRTGKVLRLGMNHLASLGASTAAYAALQRSLPQAEPDPEMNEQTLFERFKGYMRSVISGEDIPVNETKDKTMSAATVITAPMKRDMPAAAVGELSAKLIEMGNMLAEYGAEKDPDATEEEETEERMADQEERSVQADERTVVVEKQLAESRSLLTQATWQNLIQAGKVSPDQQETFATDVKELGLERTVKLYDRMNADTPPFGNITAGQTGDQNQAAVERAVRAAAEILDMPEQIAELLPAEQKA